MAWIPTNKATGVSYPPVDDAGRDAMQNDPMTKGKYTFAKTEQPAEKTTPAKVSKEPVGGKKIPAAAEPNPETEKE